MRPWPKVVALAGIFALAIAWLSGQTGLAGSQEGAEAAKSARGGLIARAGRHQFEVFFYPTGVRVFPQDHAGAAVDASKLAGTATFYHPNSPKPWFSRPLRPTPDSLDLAIGLADAPQSGAKVAFELAGISGLEEPAVAFTVPLVFAPRPAAQPTVAQPAAPAVVAPGPRYVYGPGFYGFGYYRYPGPEAAPAQASGPAVFGYGARGGGSGSGGTHDWSTGRDLPSGGLISKPWLRPMD